MPAFARHESAITKRIAHEKIGIKGGLADNLKFVVATIGYALIFAMVMPFLFLGCTCKPNPAAPTFTQTGTNDPPIR